MAKSPPKNLDNQSYQRSIINCHVKVKHPKNLPQQSARKMDEKIVNTTMDQLDGLYGNRSNNNINHFDSLFESDG